MSEILGVLFAVLVGMMVIPKFATYQQMSNNNTRAAITAQQQTQIDTATTAYIQQNSVAIQSLTTPTVPVVITVAMMQTAGLSPTFSATNPYGQTWQAEVLQPTAGNLQVLTMSTGGTAIPDAQAGKIAAIVGQAGGLIPKNDSGIYPGGAANAYGASGGWNVSTANYTSVAGGHPAALLYFNNGQLVSNYLYRNAVPGQPQLNQMNTAIDMQQNNINNVGTLTAAGGRAIAWNQLTEGGVLQLVGANGVSMYLENINGTFRLLNSAWNAVPFSIDQNGNVVAEGNVTASGTVSAAGDITAGGNITAASNFTAGGTVNSVGTVNAAGTANSWSLVGYGGTWNLNAQPQNGSGSANVNDVYIRSVSQWASQMGAPSGSLCGSAMWDAGSGRYVNNANCMGEYVMSSCPAGYTLSVTGAAYSNWFYSCIKT